ncbi:VOC family protein [Actinocorallia longicatena]|uniref:VOC family protein n=2 Tax=Actinocorallia longicatena TaxID=111803 RepID=A0ABP6PW54_9ACTN
MAFVPTTDLDRAREFYTAILGLKLVEADGFACVLRSGETMLRVIKVERLAVQPYTVLGWAVDDLVERMAELVLLGVEFTRHPGMDQDDLGVWTSPSGERVAWFADPDGNTLSLTQFAAPARIPETA